ncbi:MAG TPA: hypothetical protein VFE30_17565 [Anaeromyxobacteraceae bacterium]|jgi:hypothetical protein|nr:hypothetical protein [Anaeromyxobacteraceae bacterium]
MSPNPPPTAASSALCHPSELVDAALRLAGSSLRHLTRVERYVDADALVGPLPRPRLLGLLSTLLAYSSERLTAPLPARARWLRVEASAEDGALRLAVEDGARDPPRGQDLALLAEAVRRLGGTLEVCTGENRGTQFLVRLAPASLVAVA